MGAFLVVLLILAILAGLIWLGYGLAREELAEDRTELDARRQVLDVEWQALENSRRVNEVFFKARDKMRRAEAEQDKNPPPRQWP
jgi:hypothetical protein